jgi:hypothetical protein
MIQIISIHIPKTAGTAFYHVLKKQYGTGLSPSYKRKHIKSLTSEIELSSKELSEKYAVLHGHFRYQEIIKLHENQRVKLITWVRDPVERLISNYHFFKHRLQNPELNPVVFEKNKHRINESLEEYAQLEENRNRMSWFLEGISIEEFFFIGIMEDFNNGLIHLSTLLNWSQFELPPMINTSPKTTESIPIELRNKVASLNQKDVHLYQQILNSHKKRSLL